MELCETLRTAIESLNGKNTDNRFELSLIRGDSKENDSLLTKSHHLLYYSFSIIFRNYYSTFARSSFAEEVISKVYYWDKIREQIDKFGDSPYKTLAKLIVKFRHSSSFKPLFIALMSEWPKRQK